jgi:polysaccharide biosynthesis/export protein
MSYVHKPDTTVRSGLAAKFAVCFVAASLGACSSFGSSGPSTSAIRDAGSQSVGASRIEVVEVTDEVARRALATDHSLPFSEALGDPPPERMIVGPGDLLEITIWEAPPAVLFGANATFGTAESTAVLASTSGVSQKTSLPETMVDTDGLIRVPFAGAIPVSGRTPQQIEREIVRRLSGKAHDPQVIVRLASNADANVTVVGDVGSNTRVSLTPRGERVLDVLASAGGVKQPVNKMTVQITRGDQVVSLPLETVINDPRENIRLRANDIVTAKYQPYAFTALGATGSSAEIPFESTGLSLSQAIGRVGGLRDDRANISGVFVFRLEKPAALDPQTAAAAPRTPDGLIPVIYRVDLKNPATLFVAQSFPIRNRDMLYVSSAPVTDLQKFISIIASMAFPLINLGQTIPAIVP